MYDIGADFAVGWLAPTDSDTYSWQPADDNDLALVQRPEAMGRKPYWPFRETPGLFLEFARLDVTPAATLAFINRRGPLTRDDSDRFSRWRDQVVAMKECVEVWEALRDRKADVIRERFVKERIGVWDYRSPFPDTRRRNLDTVPFLWAGDAQTAAHGWLAARINDGVGGDVSPRLGFNPPARYDVDYVFGTLTGAMYWQLALAVRGGKRFKTCSECGKVFEVAGERERGSRRTDRETCSDPCRARRARRRKVQAGQMHAEGVPVARIAKELGSDVKVIKNWLGIKRGT
jgi:hypothetical protein